MATLVEMTHENLPGVTRRTSLNAYRYGWFPVGWRSEDDPEWTGSGDVPVSLSVEGDLFVRGGDMVVGAGGSAITLTADDGALTLPAITVGGVEITGAAGAPKIFTIDGAINTFHDFALIPATHMTTDGTPPSAATAGAPRAILAAGNKVTWAREVPAGWGQISLNILFTKEVAGSGNVHWSLAYQVVDFLTGESLAGAATTIDIGAVSVPTTAQASKYFIPPGTQAILTPQQPFGIPPMIRVELTRVNDATDTYGDANGIGVAAMSMSRTDP